MWTDRTPDAGDPGAIRRVARVRDELADRLGDRTLTELRGVIDSSADGSWTGESATAFHAQAQTIPVEVGRLIARLRTESDALVAYARAVEGLIQDASALRAREAAAHADLATATSTLSSLERAQESVPDPADLARSQASVHTHQARLRMLDGQWEELAAVRRAADAACEAGIAPPPPPVIGTLSGAELAGLSDARVLSLLAGLTGPQLLELLGHDHALAARIGALKNPQEVAAWWGSLGDPGSPAIAGATQLALVGLIPGALGNLEGVAYWARDASNRTELRNEIASLEKLKKALMNGGKIASAAQLDKLQRDLYNAGFDTADGMMHYLNSLIAIRSTLGSSTDVPYQLVNFIQPDMSTGNPDDRNPLAAISVGDMDVATNVTVDVPGMGTTVLSSMRSWTEDAVNVYGQQAALEAKAGSPGGKVAVVAWIGYDTPHMATDPSLEVLSLDKARVGARSLSSFLEGVSASHDWAAGSHLSVVAHSYGTTTSSLALTTTPVDNFTMLASAGLDPSINNANDLLVPAGHVWSSQSSLDDVAGLGRGPEIAYDVDGQHQWVSSVVFQHPVNPTDPAWGGRIFTSEDVVFHGQAYPGSDGHDASPQVTAQLDHTSTYDYGYFDRGTISLLNTAKSSLGMGGEATASNTTAVPLSAEAQRDISTIEQYGGIPVLPANYGLPWGPGP